MADTSPAAPTAAVRRWMLAGLGAAALVLLALVAVALKLSPPAALVVAALPVAAVAAAVAVGRPDVGLVSLLALTVVLFQPDEGLEPTEVVYLLLYLLVLATWYGSRIIGGEPLTSGRMDRVALFLSVVGVGGGIVLGVVHGAPVSGILGEAIGFSTLALFLPVRDLARRHRHGALIVGGVLIWFGIWIAVRNAFAIYTALTSATQIWQITEVRASNGDLILHIATVVAFATATVLRGRTLRLLVFAAGVVCLAGVFLAKSRGYWVDLVLALGLLFAFAPPRARLWLVGGGTATLLGLLGAVVAFAGSAGVLILSGAVRRLASIGSSVTKDVSLINRFYESEAAWRMIRVNPVAGHGFGTEFAYHSLIVDGSQKGSFIHNGFTSLWFKLGLWGLVLVLALWAASGVAGVLACRYAPGLSRVERGAALGAGAAVLSLLPTMTTSNPFLLFDTLVVVVVTMALAHGLYQRGRRRAAEAPAL